MTNEEKYLYHQVHSLKLLTDWSAGLLALHLFWKRALSCSAVVLAIVPLLLVSGVLIRFASLENYTELPRGCFVKAQMTKAREAMLLLRNRISRY